jgi:hypothetical protein
MARTDKIIQLARESGMGEKHPCQKAEIGEHISTFEDQPVGQNDPLDTYKSHENGPNITTKCILVGDPQIRKPA